MATAVALCFDKLHEENNVIISDRLLLEVLVSLEILAIQQDPVRKTIRMTSEKTWNWRYGQDYASWIDLETSTSAGQKEYCSVTFW